ncbi:magnesium transporter [Endozoicomonas gorgoniicola]|uniref:Magnesium transporter n=1 Tax=Endozoicomonas gorgoniicola TaxID=1234144 RepID=A0ABT3N1C8_9GAMM|nr:magnesium transporter [Endozoicomonas gorgoniicola]MCW7555438.1 magnesium transporter [Endozoicomonas gorgoniicola]
MAVADMAVTDLHLVSVSESEFDTAQAIAFMRYLSLKEKAEFIIGLTLSQANDVLSGCPLREVQDILELLEDSEYEVRARQISMGLGLISSEVEPVGEYLDNSVMSHVRERIGWIIGLALMGIVSGLIISRYEDALSSMVLLAVYMPVVAAAGGNTGSQAATLVVRALATGDIGMNDWVRVVWKEFRVACFISMVLALVIGARVVMFSGSSILPEGISLQMVAFAIGLAISMQVIMSTTLGGVLPLIARAFRLDPAVLVSPVLASVVDITGMLIYFFTVTQLLGI